jgi:hypothetical protein
MAREVIGRARDQCGFRREEKKALYFLAVFTPREGGTQVQNGRAVEEVRDPVASSWRSHDELSRYCPVARVQ